MKAAEAATNRYAESAHVCIRKVFRILSLAPRLGDDMKRRSSLIIFKREHDGARVVSKVKHEFLASTLRNGVFLMGLGAHKLSAALSSCLHSTTGVQITLRATDVSSGSEFMYPSITAIGICHHDALLHASLTIDSEISIQ